METPHFDTTGVNKIDVLCCAVSSVTEEDFKEIEQSIQDQRDFNTPLLPKTTEWQHQLAGFNERVLKKVRELKDVIAEGEGIGQPEEKPEMLS